eukprot:CAMPEP_0195035444 /NCGR_PEP_ID=MMETSP0326_2-20130528/70210_1 /TAXON_ID=2866 ORGANISM="Crypthecodinium cohnii, Strain Seligo" /NCGR_SAMPLE_ID=MMETSP0326_2 /ASSEMBLY_ACC=CAM_ASM_000348 /LENGTH=35 /DNA_ID= /DNA_START= /DNA_END= /DNA_ORIENTATION=
MSAWSGAAASAPASMNSRHAHKLPTDAAQCRGYAP